MMDIIEIPDLKDLNIDISEEISTPKFEKPIAPRTRNNSSNIVKKEKKKNDKRKCIKYGHPYKIGNQWYTPLDERVVSAEAYWDAINKNGRYWENNEPNCFFDDDDIKYENEDNCLDNIRDYNDEEDEDYYSEEKDFEFDKVYKEDEDKF